MNLIPIAARLEEQGVATVGQTVFINFMPSEVSLGILLRDYFGGTRVIPELPGYYKASYMMVVRCVDMDAGLELMSQAVLALTLTVGEELSGHTFKYMRPRNLPFTYAPSPGQNIEIAVNMDCCFIDATP